MTINSTSILKKILILFLIIGGLYFAKSYLMPIAIGGVLATLFLPLCVWMEVKKFPKFLAVLFCMLLLLSVITGIGLLLGWQVSELVTDFELVKEKIIYTVDTIQGFIFNNLDISVSQQSQLLESEQGSVVGILRRTVGSAATVLSYLILILVYFFLILYYRSHLKAFILKISPANQRNEVSKIVHNVANVSQQYLVGMAKMIFLLWIMYGIGFSLLGVKNALFFAVLCGLLEIVPYIGNLTGTTLTLLVALVNGASPIMLIGIVSTYGTVQFIQGWFLEPLILGPQVKINPLFTILALVVGQLIWGVPGVFLAIPIIAMLKIIFDNVESMKPYGFLIGELEVNKVESTFIKRIKSWFKRK